MPLGKRGVAGDRKGLCIGIGIGFWVSGYTDNVWWAPLCAGVSMTHLEKLSDNTRTNDRFWSTAFFTL